MKKYCSEIDRTRFPENHFLIYYDEKIYLDHYRDLKLFYKVYVGEPMLNPIITHDKMKTYYPSQKLDLRFQIDLLPPN